jgi:hypothetical protein
MGKKPPEKRTIVAIECGGQNLTSEEGKKAFLREAKIEAWARRRYGGDFGLAVRLAEYQCRKILKNSDDEEMRAFASEVLKQVQWTKHWIKQASEHGDNGWADQAAASAFSAGIGWAMAKMKSEWEDLAIASEKQRAALPKATAARRQKAAENRPDWWDDALQDAQDMRQKNGKRSRTNIAEELADKYRYSARQVSTALKTLGFN